MTGRVYLKLDLKLEFRSEHTYLDNSTKFTPLPPSTPPLTPSLFTPNKTSKKKPSMKEQIDIYVPRCHINSSLVLVPTQLIRLGKCEYVGPLLAGGMPRFIGLDWIGWGGACLAVRCCVIRGSKQKWSGLVCIGDAREMSRHEMVRWYDGVEKCSIDRGYFKVVDMEYLMLKFQSHG